MQIFVQPEDLCIAKGKKDERHVHYKSLHRDQVLEVPKTEKRNHSIKKKKN